MPYANPADASARWARYYKAKWPAVLAQQQRRRRTEPRWWISLCEMLDWRCYYCGKRKPLTKDHLIPREKGGPDDKTNLVPACKSCNSSKGARWVHDWRPDLKCPCPDCARIEAAAE